MTGLGQTIRGLRTAAGLTQEALAEKLYVSRELVSKWEQGKRLPDVRAVKALALLFSVAPETLLPRGSTITQELSSCLPRGMDLPPERMGALLNRFLETLSERERGVFLRRYYVLEDAAEIGAAYGIKANYARTMLARTRKKLKRFLEEEAIK